MTPILDLSPVSLVVLLLAAVVASFVSQACSTSPQAIGFRVELKHVDSGKNMTKFVQIQHGIKRGQRRLQKMNAAVLDAKLKQISISSPVSPGTGIGEFYMDYEIGTPRRSVRAVVDTGSDLVWAQLLDPEKSRTFIKLSCSSKQCKALPLEKCDDGCRYFYGYGDGSHTEGDLATETFTFGNVSVINVAFGCGVDKKDDGFDPEAALVGLGRGILSLVSQLEEPIFAYCVSYIGNIKHGILLMGPLARRSSKSHETKTTPLIESPALPSFYYLSLKAITVGDTKLTDEKFVVREDGRGGLIIDSGTTVTFLPKNVFDKVANLFIKQIKLTVFESNSSELPLCFKLSKDSNDVEIPELIFHFDGADLKLPVENYMIADTSSGLICLAMVPTLGSMSIFGNFQQQNMLVIHDLVEKTVSFVPTQCAKV